MAIEELLTEPGSTSGADALILKAMCSSGNPFDKLARYAAAARRDYHRAHRSLMQSRAGREKAEVSALKAYIHHVMCRPVAPKIVKVQNKPNSERHDPENLALRL